MIPVPATLYPVFNRELESLPIVVTRSQWHSVSSLADASGRIGRKVRVAMAMRDLTVEKIARAIGRSDTLVIFMFQGKHKGFAHRAKILKLLGLRKEDEAEVFNDPPQKSRRAA